MKGATLALLAVACTMVLPLAISPAAATVPPCTTYPGDGLAFEDRPRRGCFSIPSGAALLWTSRDFIPHDPGEAFAPAQESRDLCFRFSWTHGGRAMQPADMYRTRFTIVGGELVAEADGVVATCENATVTGTEATLTAYCHLHHIAIATVIVRAS